MRNCKPLLAGLLGALLLAGCSLTNDYFGEKEAPPLPGEREAVLDIGRGPVADPDIALLPVTLPPMTGTDWPVAGGDPAHTGGQRAWNPAAGLAWQVDAGAGAEDEARRPPSPPIVSDGRVYVLDAELVVRAFDSRSGTRLWQADTAPEEEEEGFGGGLASDGPRVYMAGGHAQAVALNAADGKEIWRTKLPGPARAAPAIAGKLVIIVTADNGIVALNAEDGHRVWSLPGTGEGAGLLGGAAPAVFGDATVVPLSFGDLAVLRSANGRELWRASMGTIRRYDSGTRLSDFGGPPAISDNIVYATSVAGRTAAFSMRIGNRLWEQRLGGSSAPWVAGDFLFVVTDNEELVCLYRPDGRVRWVQPLPRFEDPEDQDGPLTYAGPVLAGGRLVLVRSNGALLQFDPENGAGLAALSIGPRTLQPPIAANGTVYTLSEDGTLSAFR
ncbi:MAG: PQQ-binding-like beta-propeller repeat protein [Alphaproteobacteria bacterium]|nr:PQQ-binding-like beta-propeller repeat protein [Alphaproteobacteria bacterium]MCB9928195.1 PQQ-binding-like beta-propeller repeat protein [Alphaproteobacteria bacterium]